MEVKEVIWVDFHFFQLSGAGDEIHTFRSWASGIEESLDNFQSFNFETFSGQSFDYDLTV